MTFTPSTTEILEAVGLDPTYIAQEMENSRRARGTRSSWDIGGFIDVVSPSEALALIVDLEAEAMELAERVAQRRLVCAQELRCVIGGRHRDRDDIDEIDDIGDVAGLVHWLRQRGLQIDDAAQGNRDGYVIDAVTAVAYASCRSLRADDVPWAEVELLDVFKGKAMLNTNWETLELVEHAWGLEFGRCHGAAITEAGSIGGPEYRTSFPGVPRSARITRFAGLHDADGNACTVRVLSGPGVVYDVKVTTATPAPSLEELTRDAWETGHALKAAAFIGVNIEDVPGYLVGLEIAGVDRGMTHVSVLDLSEVASDGYLQPGDDVHPIVEPEADDASDLDMLRSYLSCMGEWDYTSADTARDNYEGEFTSGADLVEQLVEEGVLGQVPEWAARYVDYEAAWECDFRHGYLEAYGYYWSAH